MASAVLAFREAVLAGATGIAAGAAGTFVVARSVWEHAQAHADTIDRCTLELAALQGKSEEAPRRVVSAAPPVLEGAPGSLLHEPDARAPRIGAQPMSVPSLLDLRLRRDVASAWNAGVANMYKTVSKWL
jgi:hypothetical protein